jgi:serine/threonine-protein kinase RsbW
VSVRVSAELPHREVVGQMLRALCLHLEQRHGCAGLEWCVRSAFHEAFNNVVEHAGGPGAHEVVTVEARVEATQFVLEVIDEGKGFDFEAVSREEPPSLETLDEGGMGLFIIRSVMTAVSYTCGSTNRLTMVKQWSDCRPARAAHTEGEEDEGKRC